MLPADVKKKWGYAFNLTYSVTLDTEGLETGLVVRNTGNESMEFQVLFHGYWAVEVGCSGILPHSIVLLRVPATRMGEYR